MSSLPDSILADTQHDLVVEDVVLDLFRRRMPDIRFSSLIEQDRPSPFVLLRKVASTQSWSTDPRFMETFYFTAEVYTGGLDADADGPRVIYAMRNSLTRAALNKDPVLDGLGWVQSGRLVDDAARRSDWANSEGPVQYADLPQRWVRYIATFRIQIKRAHVGPNVFNS